MIRLLVAVSAALLSPFIATAQPQIASVSPHVSQLKLDLEGAVAAGTIPGAIVVVQRDGHRLADVTVGFANLEQRQPLQRDAIFRLYSMSKPLTSVAIMMLVEQGKLSLADPVEKFLPAFAALRVYRSGPLDAMVTEQPKRSMTIEDLLTHRAGVGYHFGGTSVVHQYYRKFGVMRDTPVGRLPGDGAPAPTLDALVDRIANAPLFHHPGDAFTYSYSTTILGKVIEQVTGERLDLYLDRTIFAPLGMRDSGFIISDAQLPRFTSLYGPGLSLVERPETSDYRDPDRLLDGGGAIAGTTDDYLRFAQMLANGGEYAGVRLLSTQSVHAMFQPRVVMGGMGAQKVQFGYGFSIGDHASGASGIQPAGTASWSGSGNTYFFVDPDRKAVALLMTHVLGDGTAVRGVVNRAATTLLQE